MAMLVVALTASGVPAGSAQDGPGFDDGAVTSTGVSSDLDLIIQQIRDELGESSEAMVRAAADLRLADSALPRARQTAAHTRELLVSAQRRQEQSARLRGQAQVRLILGTQEAEASAAAMAEQQANIGRLARGAYQSGGMYSDVSMLLSARSPGDLAGRLVSLQTLASSQRSLLDDLANVEQSHAERIEALAQVRDALASADETAQRELATVAALEAQARAAEQEVGRLVSARAAALEAARAAQAADDAAAARRDSVSGALQAELAARAGAEAGSNGALDGATVPAIRGALAWPVTGRLSSPFGMRVHPVTGVYKLHTGQDIAAPCGTPLRAAREGLVIDSGWNSAYGWRTVVSHGVVGGVLLTTTYNHQQGLGVAVGDRVGTGQVIGSVGSTGYSTGCHLHVELYVNATVVDPLPWLS
ncbi:MAG: peptidoglycan DD-metalloendopeptidase family protein [Sporichthyaceae bacterium]|nr:peptidoglycan DD-metalloendopeptidase family protein [Sporichthyaceae bacterium]